MREGLISLGSSIEHEEYHGTVRYGYRGTYGTVVQAGAWAYCRRKPRLGIAALLHN